MDPPHKWPVTRKAFHCHDFVKVLSQDPTAVQNLSCYNEPCFRRLPRISKLHKGRLWLGYSSDCPGALKKHLWKTWVRSRYEGQVITCHNICGMCNYLSLPLIPASGKHSWHRNGNITHHKPTVCDFNGTVVFLPKAHNVSGPVHRGAPVALFTNQNFGMDK